MQSRPNIYQYCKRTPERRVKTHDSKIGQSSSPCGRADGRCAGWSAWRVGAVPPRSRDVLRVWYIQCLISSQGLYQGHQLYKYKCWWNHVNRQALSQLTSHVARQYHGVWGFEPLRRPWCGSSRSLASRAPTSQSAETLADLAFANKLNLPSMTAEMHK